MTHSLFSLGVSYIPVIKNILRKPRHRYIRDEFRYVILKEEMLTCEHDVGM